MNAPVPEVLLGYSENGQQARVLVNGKSYTTLASVLKDVPLLRDPDHASTLARLAIHLAHTGRFRVIDDPQKFRDAYLKRLAAEGSNAAPWRQGTFRLSDFGVPDFSPITPATSDRSSLICFAVETLTGLPYRVTFDLRNDADGTQTCQPLPLSPIEA